MNVLLSSSSRPLFRVPSQRFLSTSVNKPIRWGILSAGKIASDYAKAIAITHGAEVRASVVFIGILVQVVMILERSFLTLSRCIPLFYSLPRQAAAVAARSSTKAQEFADKHDIPKAYGSYDELLADDDIDCVYVGSIADYHFPLAAQSILAGKPTVVEKPLTLRYGDTKSLVQLARQKNTFLM